jgi:glycosyltransferase involved in cell wall biosynthesis
MNEDQKTVLFYTDTPIVGGAENQMYLLAKFLNKERYKVIIVCSFYKQLDDWVSKFTREEIEVIRLNVMHKHDPRHYIQLKDIIKDRDIDLFHIHVWNPASCRYALKVATKYNLPTVITEHDPFKLPKLKNYIKKNLLKKVDHVIAVSDSNKKLLINMFPQLKNRITTIHNGIDVTWFESQNISFNEQKIKEYKMNNFEAGENTKIILSVAELHERKGLKYLIKAMPFVLKMHKNCKLAIAGTGPELDKLKKTALDENIENKIVFLGFKKDIPHLMKASDVFVLPSEKEAFGLVLLEAMAAKLPIVASNVGGIPEIVEHKINGELVTPHDAEKLADAILKFFNNKNIIDVYTENGLKKLKEKFDAKMMAKKTEKIYDEVLKND